MGRFGGVLLLFFAQFCQNAAGALRVQESDVQAVCAVARSLVNEAKSLAVAQGECFANAVFNLEGNMVNALAAIVEELLHGALGASRLQEFQFHFANLEEGCLYFLVFYNLCFVHFQSEHVAEVRQYLVNALCEIYRDV